MITGIHAVIFTTDAEADRAFFRDILELRSVDAGGGWPIFALPPAELAAHPADEDGQHELYLMCDDVHATVDELKRKGVESTGPISDEGWGLLTAIKLPGGGELGLYEPRHPTPEPVSADQLRQPRSGPRRSPSDHGLLLCARGASAPKPRLPAPAPGRPAVAEPWRARSNAALHVHTRR
jgi:catechol 2,3-dioxygenase-like lactoylglutathione lyase family enzyme